MLEPRHVLSIDHRLLLVINANLSWRAEHGNVEFGVLVEELALAESVGREMRRAVSVRFERVPTSSPGAVHTPPDV